MTAGESLNRRQFLRAGLGTALAAGAGTAAAQEGTTHTVEMTDGLVFDPDDLTIEPGDTVVWENVGAIGHSVTAYEAEIPEEATYFASGDFDSEDAARNSYRAGDPESGDITEGMTYEHTFEVAGSYDYFCIPHESAGMVGTIQVGGDGGNGGGDGGNGGGGFVIPEVPDSARTLAVSATITFLSVLGLSYVFMKYGGDYLEDDATE
ncbi:plastocyanin/azurin family copper-binding protein [Halomicroarcula sp. GCM10025709]|uniref:plastocyanin/azurin family copper-binding protein n=1 Tax=Haloarcula TaxID=2237 RepID=UPI0024C3AF07|nr:plastocyanin/azurin family copper-binding protein [Halomicroarcula sp. YJ-61-S]